MPLYFAYGSNMDQAAMVQRCPHAKLIGPARLPRHRFLINEDGYATVVRDPRRTVHGVLWDLAMSDIPPLDRYESLHTGLYTKMTQPVIAAAGARRALIYVGRSAKPGQPKPRRWRKLSNCSTRPATNTSSRSFGNALLPLAR